MGQSTAEYNPKTVKTRLAKAGRKNPIRTPVSVLASITKNESV